MQDTRNQNLTVQVKNYLSSQNQALIICFFQLRPMFGRIVVVRWNRALRGGRASMSFRSNEVHDWTKDDSFPRKVDFTNVQISIDMCASSKSTFI